MNPILVGIPFDGGIRMMRRFGRGVMGAVDGPAAVMPHLASTTAPKEMLDLKAFALKVDDRLRDDPVSVRSDNQKIIAAHQKIASRVEAFCRGGHMPIGIGGDHSITYPLVAAWCRAHPGRRLGLIYIDAHLDLRPLETHAGVEGLISSGNPFYRIIEDRRLPVDATHMVAVGVQPATTPIFEQMQSHGRDRGLQVVTAGQCRPERVAKIAADAVAAAGADTDGIYLSLDMDAVDARWAPGVSAPAANGLSTEIWLGLIDAIARSGRLVAADLVEISSREGVRVPPPTDRLGAQTVERLLQITGSR